MHTLSQQFIGNFTQVVDFGYCHYSIPSQVGVDDDRLRIGVADDTQSLMSLEVTQFVLSSSSNLDRK